MHFGTVGVYFWVYFCSFSVHFVHFWLLSGTVQPGLAWCSSAVSVPALHYDGLSWLCSWSPLDTKCVSLSLHSLKLPDLSITFCPFLSQRIYLYSTNSQQQIRFERKVTPPGLDFWLLYCYTFFANIFELFFSLFLLQVIRFFLGFSLGHSQHLVNLGKYCGILLRLCLKALNTQTLPHVSFPFTFPFHCEINGGQMSPALFSTYMTRLCWFPKREPGPPNLVILNFLCLWETEG